MLARGAKRRRSWNEGRLALRGGAKGPAFWSGPQRGASPRRATPCAGGTGSMQTGAGAWAGRGGDASRLKVKYPGCGRVPQELRATDRSGRARTGRDFEGELRCCGRARERRHGRVGGASAGGKGIRGRICLAGPRHHAPGRSPYTHILGLGRTRLGGRRWIALVFRRPGPAPALGAPFFRRVRRRVCVPTLERC